MERKGLGRNKGKGYYNMVYKDPYIHGLSAKGVKTYVPYTLHHNPRWGVNDFGDKVTYKKKGLIKELARKVSDGVGWAIEWEKKHLPGQKEWVKKEFEKAKQGIDKLNQRINDKRAEAELKKEGFTPYYDLDTEKSKDMEDIRDEVDTNDDGIQDKTLQDLDEVNAGIRQDLDTIDLDSNEIPDYEEVEPLDVQVTEGKAGSIISTLGDTLGKYLSEKVAERKAYKKHLDELSNNELETLAIRTGRGLFGSNAYEMELYRRQEEKIRIEANLKNEARRSAQRYSGQGSSSSGGFGDTFSFINPLSALKPNTKRVISNSEDGFDAFGFINPLNTLKGVRR
jgi:hypothetical protein